MPGEPQVEICYGCEDVFAPNNTMRCDLCQEVMCNACWNEHDCTVISGPTPGPWQITEWPGCEVDRGRIVIECAESVRQEGRVIAFIRGSPNMPPEEVMPNAHLIASAPKLLAHAKAVMCLLTKHGPSIVPHLLDDDDNEGEFLRRTIREAEGH